MAANCCGVQRINLKQDNKFHFSSHHPVKFPTETNTTCLFSFFIELEFHPVTIVSCCFVTVMFDPLDSMPRWKQKEQKARLQADPVNRVPAVERRQINVKTFRPGRRKEKESGL